LNGWELTVRDGISGDHYEPFVVEVEVLRVDGYAVAVALAEVSLGFDPH
jgi:hypothetical protein